MNEDVNKEHVLPSCSCVNNECVNNDFVTVLWRRLYFEMRLPIGWNLETMERHFREIVERTLKEYPPK